MASNGSATGNSQPNTAAAPFNPQRFNEAPVPKENMVKITEAKSPVRFNEPNTLSGGGNNAGFNNPGRPVAPGISNNNTTGNTNNVGRPREFSGPNTVTNQPSVTQQQPESRPVKWFNSGGGNFNESNNNNTGRPAFNNNGFSSPEPHNSGFSSPNWGGGNSGGGSWGGSRGGGSFGGGGGFSGGHAGHR